MSDEQELRNAARKELADMEGTAKDISAETVGNLGRVQLTRDVEEELKDINEKIGYVPLLMENLPSKGKFYRDDMRISIRSSKVAEIRDFSTMDENNLFDVDEKLNNILNSCTRVEYGSRRGTYRDILEEDRLFIILSIRELTFKQGENKLVIGARCEHCKGDNSYELRTNVLQYHTTEDFDKYYDDSNKCFAFETKSSGVIRMAPPTIGVMRVVTEYIREKEQKKEAWDKSFLQILPFLQRDWRGFDSKTIFNQSIDFQGWSTTKYTTVYRLAEKLKVGVKQELSKECAHCGGEVTVPISFPGGVKSLFVISDLSSELL